MLPDLAIVQTLDGKSAATVDKIVQDLGYILVEKSIYLKETKDMILLSGTAQGSTTARMDDRTLEMFLQVEKRRLNIPGKLQFHNVTEVAEKKILFCITADEAALAKLADLNFELRLGTFGTIKFKIMEEE